MLLAILNIIYVQMHAFIEPSHYNAFVYALYVMCIYVQLYMEYESTTKVKAGVI